MLCGLQQYHICFVEVLICLVCSNIYFSQGAKDFDLNTFKAVYRKPIKTPSEQQKEMLDAFKALDKEGNGTIQEAELRQLLLNLGDSLTSPEVEELMKEVCIVVLSFCALVCCCDLIRDITVCGLYCFYG